MRVRWLLLLCSALCLAAAPALWAAAPVILSMDVDRTTRSYAPGVVRYGEKITVRVSDADYAGDIGCVTITDSGDPTDTVTLSFCNGEGTQINNTSVSFVWTKPDAISPPRAAPYQVVAQDLGGNTDTLVTGAPPAMGSLSLNLTAPAEGSVITSTLRPTFSWQNSLAVTKIEVNEEGTQNLIWTKALAAGITSVLYANGGTVYYSRTSLLANHSYLWSLNTGTGAAVYSEPADPVIGGHAVNVKDWQEAHGRFAIYGSWGTVPLPPVLPGLFAYGNQTMTPIAGARYTSGVMGYLTDLYQRLWLGPELSDYPDWSPEGTRLLFSTPWGLFVDNRDGSAAGHVTGTGRDDSQGRWMPDGDRVVYSHWTNREAGGSYANYDVWTANLDGTEARAVVNTAMAESFPAPSPNGVWIAYQCSDASLYSSVRLVRADGSEDHALTVTGVAGQDPSYAVVSLAEPAWSPEGERLAVVFTARAPGLPEFEGVGVVSRQGGTLTPTFLSTFYNCCAYPQSPTWSPDGTQLAFASGHHKPTLTNYAIANALELWLVNADGSSVTPTQLTNDFSMTRHLAWWGPNTPEGTGVSLTREGLTITFAAVSAAGSTRVLRGGTASGLPEGCVPVGETYQILTSAQYTGPVTVAVDPASLGLPAAEDLGAYRLLQAAEGGWTDVTTFLGEGVIGGSCATVGRYTIALVLPPVARFTTTPSQGPAPLTVAFTDTSTGGPTSWAWDFGDGGASTEQHPSHEYTATGTYTVALTATNAGGSDTCTVADAVGVTVPAPVAGFSATASPGAVPLSVSFTDLSTNAPTAWAWDFGEGGTSREQNPTHTYTVAGTYTVSLTASNAGGANTCTKVDLIQALVPAPTAALTAAPTQGIAPLSVSFSDASSGSPTSWEWGFGDGGTATQQHPAHTYPTPGTYTVTLRVSNAGGSSTTTSTNLITVLPPPPTAAFSADVTAGPIPLTVQFADESAGSPTSWRWAFGDGGGSTEPSPSHTYVTPGAYTVALTVGNAGGATTETKVDYVAALVPPPVADFTLDPASGVVPLSVQFTDTSTGHPTAWAWDFGDGGTSTEQSPVQDYVAEGAYTVTLVVSNAGGSSTVTRTSCVTAVRPAPVAGFAYTPASGTAPLAVQFTDTSTNTPTAWTWDFGDGATSTEQNPSHTYTTGGSFTVSLTAANGTGADTLVAANAVTTTMAWQFTGPLPPIKADGSSVFKNKKSVQVKFKLEYADGTPVPNADARLYVAPVAANGTVGSYAPAPNADGSTSNSFVFQKKEYQFDLATRGMGSGVWSLHITVNGAVMCEVRITLG